LKTEKKSFRNFQPIKSSLKKVFLLDFLLRNKPGFYGLKIPKRLFSRFEIKRRKKTC
jgi:hypothetical protein